MTMKTQLLLDQVFQKIVRYKVSDVHFKLQAKEKEVELIYRRHKHYLAKENQPKEIYELLKYYSGLELIEFQIPQTGSFSYIIHDKKYMFRLSVMENFLLKTAVLRTLNLKTFKNLKECVQDNAVYERILQFSYHDHGLFLFCGPTGSGKSTTLHYFLKDLKNRQCYCLDSPIEIYDDDLIQIELGKHLKMHDALDQLLRHDPDVIAFGEIRNEYEMACLRRAALSGHFVCASIHAGNIHELLARLYDLGARQYELYHSLKGVVFQTMRWDKNEEKAKVQFEVHLSQDLQEKILFDAETHR